MHCCDKLTFPVSLQRYSAWQAPSLPDILIGWERGDGLGVHVLRTHSGLTDCCADGAGRPPGHGGDVGPQPGGGLERTQEDLRGRDPAQPARVRLPGAALLGCWTDNPVACVRQSAFIVDGCLLLRNMPLLCLFVRIS